MIELFSSIVSAIVEAVVGFTKLLIDLMAGIIGLFVGKSDHSDKD